MTSFSFCLVFCFIVAGKCSNETKVNLIFNSSVSFLPVFLDPCRRTCMTRLQSESVPKDPNRLSVAGLRSRLYRQRLRQNPMLYQKYLEKQRVYLKRCYYKKKKNQ